MWPTLIPILGNLLEKFLPDPQAQADAKLKMLELAQKGDLASMDAELKLALAQIAANTEEAKNPNLFVSGWRPGSGWTCVIGLAYTFLIQPLLSWTATIKGWPIPPAIDVDTLMILLGALLGVGTLRSVDKAKGVATK